MKRYLFLSVVLISNLFSQDLPPVGHIFMQGNNINTVFSTNGVFNYDRITFTGGGAGFIWPVTSPQRLTAVLSSGLWIGAKVGVQRELRLAASFYNSHYSPGNIPVIGEVPPQSVCNDPVWRGYLVQLTDPALVNGGIRNKVAGGRQYTFNYDSWANWPVNKGAPYVELNGIPGYQPAWGGDRPGIGNGMTARPDELSFMVYMDYTNCKNNIHASEIGLPGGTLPLGVEIQQINFMFNCFPLRDMYFVKCRVINKNTLSWDSVFIGNVHEPDIGHPYDDAIGCDTARNLGFYYNFGNFDPLYNSNPPAFGIRYIQSPLMYTGNPTDTAKLPYDTLTGYKQAGMSAANMFSNTSNQCISDPDDAPSAYEYLRGLNGCGEPYINYVTGAPSSFRYSGDACNKTGWYDSTTGNRRGFMSSGPFTMNSGDTQIVVSSYMITRDGGNNNQNVCALQSLSDSALYHYYNDFRLCIPIGIQPISTEIPQAFELYQNYPNPFNPTTKIRFNIPAFVETGARGVVSMKIYDALGREIETLVNEHLIPGTYEIEWNASNFPSGVYFCSLAANSFNQTKKLILLK